MCVYIFFVFVCMLMTLYLSIYIFKVQKNSIILSSLVTKLQTAHQHHLQDYLSSLTTSTLQKQAFLQALENMHTHTPPMIFVPSFHAPNTAYGDQNQNQNQEEEEESWEQQKQREQEVYELKFWEKMLDDTTLLQFVVMHVIDT